MYIFILTFTPITEERLIFVTNKEMKDFKLNDIQNHTLLVTEKGCSYREQLEKILYKYSFSTKQMIEFLGIESLKKHLKKFRWDCAIAGVYCCR